ncbi:hypothetical protein [Symbiopectobacterium purcellii]|uniref:hypothetical protein n=1 Tax=Symbiopectobacterium purcellii TaxID=2871826 RepID=UPI003F87D66A
MTAFPGQSVRPSTAVDTIESRVGIASEFPADGRARQSKLSGDGIANRLKNDYILCPDMRQRSIAGCYQNNVAWLYSRQIVGWQVDRRMTSSLVCGALMKAYIAKRLGMSLGKNIIAGFRDDLGARMCFARSSNSLC